MLVINSILMGTHVLTAWNDISVACKCTSLLMLVQTF